MKDPRDEYRDAMRTKEALDRDHADAKVSGYYKGSRSGGAGTRFIKSLAKFLFWLLVLGGTAAIILTKYGDKIFENFK